MAYTTQDLIEFLAGERDACMDGKRLKLSPTNTGFAEEALAILQEKGIQQIGAYHDFLRDLEVSSTAFNFRCCLARDRRGGQAISIPYD